MEKCVHLIQKISQKYTYKQSVLYDCTSDLTICHWKINHMCMVFAKNTIKASRMSFCFSRFTFSEGHEAKRICKEISSCDFSSSSVTQMQKCIIKTTADTFRHMLTLYKVLCVLLTEYTGNRPPALTDNKISITSFELFVLLVVAAQPKKPTGGWQLTRCSWLTLVASTCKYKHALCRENPFLLTYMWLLEWVTLSLHRFQRWNHWHHSHSSLGNPHRYAKGKT